MANFEIDPLVSKALRLLHSTAEDSAEQIKAMLEEAIEQKYGGSKHLNIDIENSVEEPTKLEIQKLQDSRGPSPIIIQTEPTIEVVSRDSTPPSEIASARSTPDLNDNDYALEIFEDELTCSVCKEMAVGARNILIECSECHSLYHQECHKPPVPESEVSDPRVVWYCSNCSRKTQEKIQIKIKTNPTDVMKVKIKTEVTSEKSSNLFKRNDKPANSDLSKSSGGGMAHLAASIQSSKINAGASSSKTTLTFIKAPGSPNTKNQTGQVSGTAPGNIIAADKRLQNMKKKAAAKMQEKRGKQK